MLSPFRTAAIAIIEWVYSFIPIYGLAIIFFVLLLRIAFMPLDFGTKYFTKKNSIRMAAMKPEEQALKEAHAGDPVAYNRARQALFKKHGYGMGGFCLFTLLNMVIMMIIFMSVFQGLNMISNHNINSQYIKLQGVFHEHAMSFVDDENLPYNDVDEFMNSRSAFANWQTTQHFQDEAQLHITNNSLTYADVNAFLNSQSSFEAWKTTTHFQNEAVSHIISEGLSYSTVNLYYFINSISAFEYWQTTSYFEDFQYELQQTFNDSRVGFLWVANIWRSDTPWTNPTMDWDAFRGAVGGVDNSVTNGLNSAGMNNLRSEYRFIFDNLDTGRNWNGMLFLVALAGASTFLSSWIASKAMAKNKAKEAPKEEKTGYSLRDVRDKVANGETPQMPNIDPQVMSGKMMKFMLPMIMIIFTLTTTAALAIYITAGSLIMTGLSFIINKLVDMLIARQTKKKEEAGPDLSIINPHAKYFKTKGKKVD